MLFYWIKFMLQTWFLVLVFYGGNTGSTSLAIPQANQDQCKINRDHQDKKSGIYATCIVGAMPK